MGGQPTSSPGRTTKRCPPVRGRLAPMPATETFVLEGHIVDSLILPKVLDLVLESGSDYRLLDVVIGRTPTDPSRAVIEVDAPDDATLAALAEQLQVQGANPVDAGTAETAPAPA